ncbi:hypothetical protein ACQPU1_04755 [Clostridium paraputrificum]|uniref:hypothetical protein n=1 Tax=Clostridium TaxID=1485 RepID=UPI003D353FF9
MREKIIKKRINKISDYLMYSGVIVGVYGLYKVIVSRVGLPEGACPISDNRGILYLGMTLLISSVILSFFSDRADKK